MFERESHQFDLFEGEGAHRPNVYKPERESGTPGSPRDVKPHTSDEHKSSGVRVFKNLEKPDGNRPSAESWDEASRLAEDSA